MKIIVVMHSTLFIAAEYRKAQTHKVAMLQLPVGLIAHDHQLVEHCSSITDMIVALNPVQA